MDHYCVCVSIFFIDLAGIYVHCFGLLPQLFSLTHYSQCNMIVGVWGVVMADRCWCDLYLIKFGWCEVWSNHEGVIWNNCCGCDLYFHTILRRCDLKKILCVWFVLSYDPQTVWFEKNVVGVICTYSLITVKLRRCILQYCTVVIALFSV